MPRSGLAALFLIASSFLPSAADAAVGVARGGEHADFTRLTISSEQPFIGVAQTRLEDGSYLFEVTPKILTLDASKLFDRLSKDRIGTLRNTGPGLELVLNCDCVPEVRLEANSLVVIDVFDRSEDSDISLPVLPIEPARFPALALPKKLPSHSPDIFELDFTVVDRLSKRIAAEISRNSHIAGFSTMLSEGAVFSVDDLVQDAASVDPKVPGKSACHWPDIVWAQLVQLPTRTVGETPSVHMASDTDSLEFSGAMDATQSVVVGYLSQGLFQEAENAFQTLNPSPDEMDRFKRFTGAVRGTDQIPGIRFGECSPLVDLLSATSQNAEDLPNGVRLHLLHSFDVLSFGLQIELYPALEWLLGDPAASLYPALVTHRKLEAALAAREAELGGSLTEADRNPDRLAAVTVELRGTLHETESWKASFDSYLENHRYFDALDALQQVTSLNEDLRTQSISRFVNHLVTHSESVTFIEIAMSLLKGLTPEPGQADMMRVVSRLQDEGFLEEAQQLAGAHPGKFSETVGGAASDEGFLQEATDDMRNQSSGISVDRTGSSEGRVTVASAQEQLDRAENIRTNLLEKFAP